MPAGIALLGLLTIVACGRPDPNGVANAVNATLTASAPRVETSAAASNLGATVEALMTRQVAPTTGGGQPGAGEAPQPGRTAVMQTAAPVSTPAAWHEYGNPAGSFTLLYPDTWKIASQLVNRVTFSFQPNGVANVDVIETADAPGGLRDALGSADAIARYAMEDQAGRYVVGTVEKGPWTGDSKGYFALLDVNDYGLAVQWLYVAIPRGDTHAVLAKVALVNGKVTQEQRETLRKILSSIQPTGAATPAPQVQATAESTQAPPAQAEPAPTQPQPTQPAQPQPTKAAQAAPGAPPKVKTDQSVNLRIGPGTSYMAKTVTQPGLEYDLVGQNQDGAWYQICCVAGEKLWVSKLVVIISGDTAAVPVVEAPLNAAPVPTAPAAEETPTRAP
jgi:hypothetical protein